MYDIKYHLVWITKYRKAVLTGQIAQRTRELIRSICKANGLEILAGHDQRIISTYCFPRRRIYRQANWALVRNQLAIDERVQKRIFQYEER